MRKPVLISGRWRGRLFCAVFCAFAVARLCYAMGQTEGSQIPEAMPQGEVRRGRELLTEHRYPEAQRVFTDYLHHQPHDVQGELGLGDAELGLHEYEAAEAAYRAVTAQQPQLWQAHKNLVLVEAALGRWEEFDRERTVLQMARQRGAPGISRHESDVIDRFTAGGGNWVVRAYFEPVGRSAARYNFERFAVSGQVLAYLSMEDDASAHAALAPEDEHIGADTSPGNNSRPPQLTLNWYTGAAHGRIASYTAGEPRYEQVRADAIRWIRAHPNGSLPGQ